VTTTSWLDTTTFEGVRYTYAVAAFDAAGNVSPRSALKTALAPSVAPTKPTITTINVVSGSVNLAWTTSTDNVGVTGYRIARSTNGTLGPVVATVTGTTWLDTTVTPGVRYTYAVAAVDAAGNVSARSAFKSITP
jgi:cellulose 1,4-beta-cellobiosidase